jgi:hypothetical protein
MNGEEDAMTMLVLAKEMEYEHHVIVVQTGKRFIEEQEGCTRMEQDIGQHDPLAFSSRQDMDLAI